MACNDHLIAIDQDRTGKSKFFDAMSNLLNLAF
jgi:hypothetical protein